MLTLPFARTLRLLSYAMRLPCYYADMRLRFRHVTPFTLIISPMSHAARCCLPPLLMPLRRRLIIIVADAVISPPTLFSPRLPLPLTLRHDADAAMITPLLATLFCLIAAIDTRHLR